MAKIHISNGIVPTGVASVNQYMKEVKKARPMTKADEETRGLESNKTKTQSKIDTISSKLVQIQREKDELLLQK